MSKKIYRGISSYLQDMGRPINFYPSLVKAFGNRNVAIFIGQMGYWRDRITDKEGRIYKTAEEIEEETSLTYKEQIFVRKFLKKRGVLTERYYRSIHRLYFKINWEKVDEIWEKYLLEKDSTLPKVNCHLTQSKFVNRNTEITTDINTIPASAGGKLCECEDDEMCEKCEFLKKKIAMGEAFGFEFDVQKTKEQLIATEIGHGGEEVKEKTTDQKIFDMTRGNGYSDRLNDYPERCRKPLAYFVKKWGISEMAIPKKPKSSKGGLYATWIAGIDDLLSISGEKRFYTVIDKVYELWFSYAPEYRTPVDMPQKIKKMFVSLDGEIRNSEIEIMKEGIERAKLVEKNKVESEEYVNAEDGINLLKKLKQSIK